MSFQSNLSELMDAFAAFNNQATITKEDWKDSVQSKFYHQFIDPITCGFNLYVNDLEKLRNIIDNAEEKITEMKR